MDGRTDHFLSLPLRLPLYNAEEVTSALNIDLPGEVVLTGLATGRGWQYLWR